MPHPSFARGAGALPRQALFASPSQRVGLARERFFGDRQSPTELVNESVLRLVSRLGVNLAEGAVGTNAPAVVVKTGSAVTVLGAEHFFGCVQSLHCAASPIHDGRGRLASVLDLTVEARPFGLDVALASVYATAIENRLLQASAGEHPVLQFQADRS